MFLYIPGGEQLDFFYSITSFLLIFVSQPHTPHLEHLEQPKSPSPELTKHLHRLNVHQTRYPVSVLLETNYIIVNLSDIMTKFYEMLHQTPKSPETRPIP